jgi:HEPN domain-containing protein
MDKQKILQTWITSGIEDFYLSFELEDRWHRHSIFYCHQGLEKICKAYHIGKSSARWEELNDASALKEIDRIAKSLNHKLFQMVKCLQSRRILPTYTTLRPYTEDDLLQGLEAAYTEARYPVPHPFHLTKDQHGKERFRIPIDKLEMYRDPLGETAPRDYARSMARALLEKIETEFAVRIPDSKVSSKISDKDWKRFANIFFKA